MSFLNPIALFGLLGIGMPILIHLLSKKKREEVFFGSVQFLEPSESPAARSITLSQWWLLLLRILLIGLVVLLIAQPIFEKDGNEPLVFIEKQIIADSTYREIIDPLMENSYIPFSIDDSQDNRSFNSYNSFIEYLNALEDSIIVYSKSRMRDFRGSTIPIAANIDWKILASRNFQEEKDTVVFREGVNQMTWKNKEGFSEVSFKNLSAIEYQSDILNLYIGSSQNSLATQRDFRKIIEKIDDEWPLKVNFLEQKEDADWLIMIDTILTGPSKSGRIFWETRMGNLDMIKLSPRIWKVNGKLTGENLLRSNFIMGLSNICIESIIPITEYTENRYQPLQKNHFVSKRKKMKRLQLGGKKVSWIWIPLMVLVFIERWYAFKVR